MTFAPAGGATIEVRTSFNFLSFLLYLCKPQVSIDGGAPVVVRWGGTQFPVGPGRHQVEVWCPYLFLRNMGRSGTVVDVAAGDAVQVAWHAPLLVVSRGRITVGRMATAGYGGFGPQGGQGGYAAPGFGTPAGAAYGQAGSSAWRGAAGTAGPQTGPPLGAWHPDPTGRHEQRWWSGSVWTEHVADGGVTSVDPQGAPR